MGDLQDETGEMTLRERLTDAEHPDYGDEWTQAHKGALVRVEAFVWDCGDDYCRCSAAHVTAIFQNIAFRDGAVRIGLWAGPFYTEGEAGADADLARFRRALAASDPELEQRLVWQKGVDYDADLNGGSDG